MTKVVPNQHANSNTRSFSDDYLLPTHYDFLGDIEREIQSLKQLHGYICITDDELTMRRVLDSDNSEPMGNIMAQILSEKAAGMFSYKGLDDDIGEDYNPSEGLTKRSEGMKKTKIFDAMYSTVEKATYYFVD